jgi:hypothetical protein
MSKIIGRERLFAKNITYTVLTVKINCRIASLTWSKFFSRCLSRSWNSPWSFRRSDLFMSMSGLSALRTYKIKCEAPITNKITNCLRNASNYYIEHPKNGHPSSSCWNHLKTWRTYLSPVFEWSAILFLDLSKTELAMQARITARWFFLPFWTKKWWVYLLFFFFPEKLSDVRLLVGRIEPWG